MAQVPLLPFPSAYRPTTIITNPPSEQNVIEAVGYHADIWARRYKSTEEVPTEIIVDASRHMQRMIHQKDFGQIPNRTLQQTLDDIKAKSDLVPQLVDAVNQLRDSVNQLQNSVDQLRTVISLTTQLACETHNNVSQDHNRGLQPILEPTDRYRMVMFTKTVDGVFVGRNPTLPPHNLPPLNTIQDIVSLSARNTRAYYAGYYPDRPNDSPSLATQRRRIAVVVGAAVSGHPTLRKAPP